MYVFLLNLESNMCMYISIMHIDVISHVNISCDRCTIFSLAIRDYWDLGKEGAKDDKFVVLVSFVEIPAPYLR